MVGGFSSQIFSDELRRMASLCLTFSILAFFWVICLSLATVNVIWISSLASAILICRKPATLFPPHCTLKTLYEH
jgi:hypothetical protein